MSPRYSANVLIARLLSLALGVPLTVAGISLAGSDRSCTDGGLAADRLLAGGLLVVAAGVFLAAAWGGRLSNTTRWTVFGLSTLILLAEIAYIGSLSLTLECDT